LAASVAGDDAPKSRAAAHELLAKIALARRDVEGARTEAGLAHEADPTMPLPIFIEARILYDQGKYAEALPLFQQTIDELKKMKSVQINELHFYTGDTLGRLERYPEAETQFIEELKFYPQNVRARAGLAMLYQATGKTDAVARVIDDMIRVTP